MTIETKLSPICFGCEPLGGTDWGDINIDDLKNAIYKSLDLGINFFDTAGVYGLGLSEERLSKILGKKRHNVIIATKGGLTWKKNKTTKRAIIVRDSSPKAIRKDVESSLRRLRLELLPIFFVHWPDENILIEETFSELMRLKDEGKIKSIGCSNFSANQLLQACDISQVDYVQLPLNILDKPLDQKISDICYAKEIKIIAYNVLANGLLTGKYNENSIFPINDRRSRLPSFQGIEYLNALNLIKKLKIEATKNNISLLQYAIKWPLMEKNVHSVILGIKNPKQIEDNWAAISDYKLI